MGPMSPLNKMGFRDQIKRKVIYSNKATLTGRAPNGGVVAAPLQPVCNQQHRLRLSF